MQPLQRVSQPVLIIGGIVTILGLAAAVYYLNQSKPATEDAVPEIVEAPDVSTDVSAAAQTPAEQLPQTNPFSGYKNPFE